jgi:hypothetical protein
MFLNIRQYYSFRDNGKHLYNNIISFNLQLFIIYIYMKHSYKIFSYDN